MKRILAAVLAGLTLLSAAACGQAKKDGEDTTAKATGPAATTAVSGLDALPEKNYDGRNFRISVTEGHTFEFYVPEDSDDVVESAIYRRQRYIEDRFGVTIRPIISDGVGLFGQTKDIVRSIQSDNDDFDLTATMVAGSGELISSGVLYDWNEMPYTDLSASYWTSFINDKYQIAGHNYLTVGSTCTTALTYTYAVMMNRTLADSFGIVSDVFDRVHNGTWTIDRFADTVKTIYRDVDGEPEATVGDIYGFTAENLTNLDVYTFAFDIPLIESNEETLGFEMVVGTPKMVDAVDKILDLYWSNPGSHIATSDVGVVNSKFIGGTTVFATLTISNVLNALRRMEDDYTILPYPKFDDKQERYYTSMMDNFSVLGAPTSIPDEEFTSIITEALNIEAERVMFPAYYDVALQEKYRRDEETKEFLDLLIDGRTSDLAVLISVNLEGVNLMFRRAINMQENIYMAQYDAKKDVVAGQIADLIELIRKNEHD